MSDQRQIQHLHAKIGLENLKEFLFTEETKRVILNPKHQLWLCVNDSSATELVNIIFHVKGAVVINCCNGVSTEYYHYKKKIARDRAESGIATMLEGFRRTYETYYNHIQKEVRTKHYAILAEILEEERAKIIHNIPVVKKLNNIDYFDQGNITTPEERQQIEELGLNVGILEDA
ncbi:MAG: hypothetical protein GPJ51_11090 [Candidatus Heimdallarchaeota archaeon]|nr:hypothetical protein [Candidatus Heimdallarchaeota archaeon]